MSTWAFSRSDTPNRIATPKTISDVLNYSRFLPRRRFKTLASTQRPTCMALNCKRLVDLQEAETALAEVQENTGASSDKFEKVFRSSPIPFSITTLREGRFVDVNSAFERRYGYSRAEVLGHTVHELHMWCDPADRIFMTEQLRQGVAVRNRITWLRTKSGEIKLTVYSADRIHFDGQPCVLAVSEDLPEFDSRKAN